MTVTEKKVELVELLLLSKDISVLDKIEQLLRGEIFKENNYSDESINLFNKKLAKSEEDLLNRNVISQKELNSTGLVGKKFKDEYEFYKYIAFISIDNKDIYRLFLRIIDLLNMTYSHLDIKFEDIFIGNPNIDGCEEY